MCAIDSFDNALLVEPADRLIGEVIRRDIAEDSGATERRTDARDSSTEESSGNEHSGKSAGKEVSAHKKRGKSGRILCENDK